MSLRAHEAGIVIPTFNSAAFIGRTLDSVEASVRRYVEASGRPGSSIVLVVVDDGSTDGTVAMVEARAASLPCAVRVERNERNRGTSHSRNRGVRLADADTILFLDHDDEYRPDHVALCLDQLERRPDVGYVRTGVDLSDPVHPHWHRAIADSLVLNVCVRTECHEFMGGFHEHTEMNVLRAEDALYSDLLRRFYRSVATDHPTVLHHRLPGNALDRQFGKFIRPPGEGIDCLTEDERRAHPAVLRRHEERIQEVEAKVRTLAATLKVTCRGGTDTI